jgi:hypothetical protein
MLATLEQRLAQARAGELGHLEFLQVLCEDEINRRQAKALRERVRRTRFEQPTTLEDFDFHFNPKLPIAQLRDLATCQFVELGESVILYGPAGRQRLGLTRFYRHVFNVAKKLWRSPAVSSARVETPAVYWLPRCRRDR